jgi:hypothetical protein
MPRPKKLAVVLASALLAVLAAGCGYSLRPPYNPNIKTIYLPVMKSYRFRQDLNIQLTEMLKNEINLRTPYVVTGDPEKADARLEAVVTFDDKNVMVENPFNLPRHILATMTVNATYTDNRTGRVKEKTYPSAYINEAASFYPEIGENATAGFEKVMEKIARDIVNMMEDPWGEEYQGRELPVVEEEVSRNDDEEEPEDDTPAVRKIVRDPEAYRQRR